MVTISEIDKNGYVSGISLNSSDTLPTGSVGDTGLANGAYALNVTTGDVKFYDAENQTWSS